MRNKLITPAVAATFAFLGRSRSECEPPSQTRRRSPKEPAPLLLQLMRERHRRMFYQWRPAGMFI